MRAHKRHEHIRHCNLSLSHTLYHQVSMWRTQREMTACASTAIHTKGRKGKGNSSHAHCQQQQPPQRHIHTHTISPRCFQNRNVSVKSPQCIMPDSSSSNSHKNHRDGLCLCARPSTMVLPCKFAHTQTCPLAASEGPMLHSSLTVELCLTSHITFSTLAASSPFPSCFLLL